MDIRCDKQSDVPLHEQIAAQLVLLVATGAIRPGTLLPSVRGLAVRLGVHRNTISRAYHDLTLGKLVAKRAGARLAVLGPAPPASPRTSDLDALLVAAIDDVRRHGFSLRDVHDWLLKRLRQAPPDRVLLVTEEAGMAALLTREVTERLKCRADTCTPDELRSSPERALGAVVVSPPGHLRVVRPALARDHAVVPITYSAADRYVRTVRDLPGASLVVIVSVSEYFLKTASAVLAPAIGRRHALERYHVRGRRLDVPRNADVVFCDTLTYPLVRSRQPAAVVLRYPLIAEACFAAIGRALGEGRRRRRASSPRSSRA